VLVIIFCCCYNLHLSSRLKKSKAFQVGNIYVNNLPFSSRACSLPLSAFVCYYCQSLVVLLPNNERQISTRPREAQSFTSMLDAMCCSCILLIAATTVSECVQKPNTRLKTKSSVVTCAPWRIPDARK
jgi:hypothetical protein